MKKNKLILVSTKEMSRQVWLDFRQPTKHIREFIISWLQERFNLDDRVQAAGFLVPGADSYAILKELFASQQWKEFIFPCIGGSEISSIMGLNPYKSSIELFYEKVGAIQIEDFDNAAMFWGRELEEQIAEKWQYWDGTIEGLLDNFKDGNVIRKCRRLNYYVMNKECPWLFVSLDRVINKQNNGKETTDEGSLECKTISGYAANMWESGIPIMYVAQLQAQLLACGFEYGEIAILKDGRQFEVYPFDKNESIVDRITKDSEKFFQSVKEGAAAFLLYTYSPDEEQKKVHYAEMESLAPEPDGSDSYKGYLSERYKENTSDGIPGGIVELNFAKEYEYFRLQVKDATAKQQNASNHIKAVMKENGKLDFGSDGYCSWKNNSNGARVFTVKVKLEEGYVPESEKPEVKI